jgi:hypothetical protein
MPTVARPLDLSDNAGSCINRFHYRFVALAKWFRARLGVSSFHRTGPNGLSSNIRPAKRNPGTKAGATDIAAYIGTP